MKDRDLAEVVKHYLICAMWATNDNADPETGGDPIDDNYDLDDFAPEALKEATEDCQSFLKLVADQKVDTSWWSDEQMGHDFWLTREHHGAGFWDRGQGEPGRRLTTLAHTFGEGNLYVGDDNKLHFG